MGSLKSCVCFLAIDAGRSPRFRFYFILNIRFKNFIEFTPYFGKNPSIGSSINLRDHNGSSNWAS